MAIVRVSELRQMKGDELVKKLSDVEMELKAERALVSTAGKPNNVGKFRELKKLKARIQTILGSTQ